MIFQDKISLILTPVFGDEIYPIVHPDPDGTISSVSNLYAVYTIIGGMSFNQLEGDNPISRVRLQVSIYSIDYGEMVTSKAAMNNAMQAANLLASQCVDNHTDVFTVDGALANVSVNVPTEGRETDTRRFFCHANFYCWTKDN